MKISRHLEIVLLVAWSAAILLVVVGRPVAALGQASQPPQPSDDQVNAIARQLYCPVCENIPLDVCPTQACMQWRELIREKLSAGWTEQQIKDYFVQQYGDRVLATPPPRGLNWLAYILPSGVNPTGSVYPLPGAAQLEARRCPARRAAP